MTDCIFCSLTAPGSDVARLYEDDFAIAIKDPMPQAPFHALVLSREHALDAAALDEATSWASVHKAITALSHWNELKDGYRVVMNSGASGGQTIFHFHAHVLAGRSLSWPPG